MNETTELKKPLKVALLGMSFANIPETGFWKDTLSPLYNLKLNFRGKPDAFHGRPDLIIFGAYFEDYRFYWRDVPRIFYNAESWFNVDPGYYDYMVGYCDDSDKSMRSNDILADPLIHHSIRINHPDGKVLTTPTHCAKEKTKFCCYIASHYLMQSNIREAFVQKLMKYKRVDCPGKRLNNMPSFDMNFPQFPFTPGTWAGRYARKTLFQSDYKFSIAFENSSKEHYITEKIFTTYAAGSIPIYWGAPNVTDTLNPRAFINCHDYKDFDAVIAHIKEIDTNDALYQSYRREPLFLPDRPIPDCVNRKAFETRIAEVIDRLTSESFVCPARPDLERRERIFSLLNSKQLNSTPLLKPRRGLRKINRRLFGDVVSKINDDTAHKAEIMDYSVAYNNVTPKKKKTLKVTLLGMSTHYPTETGFWKDILSPLYDLKLNFRGKPDAFHGKPDLIIFGAFYEDYMFQWRDVPRIFYNAESWFNVDPGYYDYMFGYCADSNKSMRSNDIITDPLIYDSIRINHPDENIIAPAHQVKKKTKFCNYVATAYIMQSYIREAFVQKLMTYKRVDCPGPRLNNIPLFDTSFSQFPFNPGTWDGRYARKTLFQSDYKFSIAFENTFKENYITEKIFTTYAAGSIPIYWGAPNVADILNPRAFINCHDYETFDAVIEHIKEIDTNDALYQSYRRAPLFLPDRPIPDCVNREAFETRLVEVIEHLTSESFVCPARPDLERSERIFSLLYSKKLNSTPLFKPRRGLRKITHRLFGDVVSKIHDDTGQTVRVDR